MNNAKTEILNREKLRSLINDRSIKHLWLASQVGVSEKTLSRWLNGDVTRIRNGNLTRLADALGCDKEQLAVSAETDLRPTERNRDVLVNELNKDSLLYELLISSKISLAISLIRSTFHSTLPNEIISNFYIKLGYAYLIHRKQKKAKQYFNKGLSKAKSANNSELVFSANLGLATSLFFDCQYKKCKEYLNLCETNLVSGGVEKAHFYNTLSLHYLYCGDFDTCIEKTTHCIDECSPAKKSIEKDLFVSSALQLKVACFLFKGDIKQAKSSAIKSLNFAEKSGYKRSISVSKAYLATTYVAENNFQTATELVEESLQKIGSKDVSFPSLLCIAMYVFRAAGEKQRLTELSERLFSLGHTGSAANAFAIYQLYLQDLHDGESDAAELKLAQVRSIIGSLEINLWLDWLDKRPTAP